MTDFGDYLGKTLDQLKLEKLLGVGGMGAVFLARHQIMDVPVAVKIMPPHLANDPVYKERFFREAREAAKLDHPNIVKITWMGEQDGALFLAMEYMDGGNVGEIVDSHGPMGVDEAVRIIIPIAEALQFAHARGIIHRDIKPDNILLTAGDHPIPKIADFGLVRKMNGGNDSPTITRAGEAIGTPAFMPLEQWDGVGVDHRVDIYALGVTLYFMLSAQLPIAEEGISQLVSKLVTGQQTPLTKAVPGISPELAEIVHGAIAPQANDRFATAQAFADALKEWAAGGGSSAVNKQRLGPKGGKTRHPRGVSAPTPGRPGGKQRGTPPGAGSRELGSRPDYQAVGGHRPASRPPQAGRGPHSKPGVQRSPSVMRDSHGHETGPIPDMRRAAHHGGATAHRRGSNSNDRRMPTSPLKSKNQAGIGIAVGLIALVLLIGGVLAISGANSTTDPGNTPDNTATDAGNSTATGNSTTGNTPDPAAPIVAHFSSIADNAKTLAQVRDALEKIEKYLASQPDFETALQPVRVKLKEKVADADAASLIEQIRATTAADRAEGFLDEIEETCKQYPEVPALRERFAAEIPRLEVLRDIHTLVSNAEQVASAEAARAALQRLDVLAREKATIPNLAPAIEAAKKRLTDLIPGSGATTPGITGDPIPLPPVDSAFSGRVGNDVRRVPINEKLGPYTLNSNEQVMFGFELPTAMDLTISLAYDAAEATAPRMISTMLLDADHNRMWPISVPRQRLVQTFIACEAGRYVFRVSATPTATNAPSQTTIQLSISANPLRTPNMVPSAAVELAPGEWAPAADFYFNIWYAFTVDRPGWRRVQAKMGGVTDGFYVYVMRLPGADEQPLGEAHRLMVRTTVSESCEFVMPVEPGRYGLQLVPVKVDQTGRASACVSPALDLKPTSPTTLGTIPTPFTGGTITGAQRMPPGEYSIESPIIVPEGAQLVIPRGTTLKFASTAGIELRGELWADGSADAPILFDAQQPGTLWQNVCAQGDRARVVMRHVTIRAGGGRGHTMAQSNVITLDPASAGKVGGGVALFGCRLNVNILEDCIIEDCLCDGTDAQTGTSGALLAQHSAVHLLRCTIRRNSVRGDSGALAIYTSSTARLDDCELAQNQAARSGGALTTVGYSYAILRGVVMNSNRAVTNAGAIYAGANSPVDLYDCTFTGNSAKVGGAMIAQQAACRLFRCQFRNNTADNGGALLLVQTDAGGVWHTRFENNTANETGGALFIQDALPLFIGCEAANNRSPNGQTMYATYRTASFFGGFNNPRALRDGLTIANETAADFALYFN